MKYYIIAGEASGDLHGSNLIAAIKKLDTTAAFRCWGGDLMEKTGATIVKHYRDLAFMGFWDVLKNIKTIIKNLKFCKKDIQNFQPDVVILIDYPGFNLRIAKYVKKRIKTKIVYYISPQIWAWKQSRVYTIKKNVDRMLVILPFEKDFYANFGMTVDFVGHPLFHFIKNKSFDDNLSLQELNLSKAKKIVALLPGSRKQEISRILPTMIKGIENYKDVQFIIAGVNSIDEQFYLKYFDKSKIPIIYGKTYALLSIADAAIVTSGTATLETCLFNVPQVVCYKADAISFFIGKMLVKVKFISLVNLIANKLVIKELVQDLLTKENIENELQQLLYNEEYIEEMKSNYQHIHQQIGSLNASEEAAKIIVQN